MKLWLTCFLTASSLMVIAQQIPPLAIVNSDENLHRDQQIKLFDLNELIARKIDTVYEIMHPASWAEEHLFKPCDCAYSDTLKRYVFDSNGRLKEYTQYALLSTYLTTFYYDTAGNRIAIRKETRQNGVLVQKPLYAITKTDSSGIRSILSTEIKGDDSISTSILLVKFQKGMDTALVEIRRYDAKRRLVERSKRIIPRNANEFDDSLDDKLYLHYLFTYDSQDRLTLYQDLENNEYLKISYLFFGRLTEVFDAKTNTRKDFRIRMVKETDKEIYVTSLTDGITLTKLEKGSKLIRLISRQISADIPMLEYTELVYRSSHQ
ncbi:MAG: hypothetical protein DI535_08140 [Citrobacter freundii]|nr:MAG: hypothetical protein DI535_08140 [Citrobacter freundii]